MSTRGASLVAMQRAGGWKSPDMPAHYARQPGQSRPGMIRRPPGSRAWHQPLLFAALAARGGAVRWAAGLVLVFKASGGAPEGATAPSNCPYRVHRVITTRTRVRSLIMRARASRRRIGGRYFADWWTVPSRPRADQSRCRNTGAFGGSVGRTESCRCANHDTGGPRPTATPHLDHLHRSASRGRPVLAREVSGVLDLGHAVVVGAASWAPTILGPGDPPLTVGEPDRPESSRAGGAW